MRSLLASLRAVVRPSHQLLRPSADAAPRLLSTSAARHRPSSPSSSPSAPTPSPTPDAGITDPASFLAAISRPPANDLASDGSILGALGETWDGMWSVDGRKLKGAGVAVQKRRYLLWAMEKYRQGLLPSQFVRTPKPKKPVRGWGPRVQKGIRVRGRRRPGEK